MKLDDYSLFYKIKKYWGISRLIGKNGLDFWFALITTASFFLLYKFNIIDLNWRNGSLSFFNIFSIVILISLALIGILYTFHTKFNEDNDFTSWLIKKNIIDELELLIDYPLYVIVTSIIVLILYGILLIMFKVSNENMAILFAVPIFVTTYGYIGFIYAMRTMRYYSHAHNKFKVKKMNNSQGAK
ncbi:MAG: hypothetical protein SCH39_12700 [Methanosarcinales archaeon]|nr:hypothetical protein [Methanosarcinales archaeon]